jgi:hypothetical protein
MFIVRIFGGLGNQLFQYSFGIYLSTKYKREVFFDIEDYSKDTYRNFSLDKFNLFLPLADKNIHNKFIKFKSLKLNKYYNLLFGNKYFSDDNFRKFQISDGISVYYFNGYWQRHGYYKKISENFKFSLNNHYINSFYKEIKQIQDDDFSASVHIRRGDFLNKENSRIYKICEPFYFLNAETHLLSIYKSTQINLYVFSDDVNWVKENIRFKSNCIFIHNEYEFLDFYLMSLCKNNIISNSTFSWWAAMLNKSKDKTVIAPNDWFFDKTINIKDLLPTNWITLESSI